MNISQAVPLFSILRLSFEEVFWTFLITHGEIKVIAALHTAKEAGGELYRPFMSSSNLFPSYEAQYSITHAIYVVRNSGQKACVKERQIKTSTAKG
jgi:hypothetical protein